jgi:hypothetical protein
MELPPQFIAYVYPGWHATPYRPGVDEWTLLSRFEPSFDGHIRPATPLFGHYDDSVSETARLQIALASRAGIKGFIYFAYFDEESFVMNSPLERAIDSGPHVDPTFRVSASWCVRLPHRLFPVTSEEAYAVGNTDQCGKTDFLDLPIENTTLENIHHLFQGSNAWKKIKIPLGIGKTHTTKQWPEQASLSLENLAAVIDIIKLVQSDQLTLHSVRSVMDIWELRNLSLEEICEFLGSLAGWYVYGSTTVIQLECWVRDKLSSLLSNFNHGRTDYVE